ncbi:MAG: hypothetical protein IKO00_17555 [Oscillospiraceae bacterium]|nr:hypothetical protein [Oscillospiraceae bacterium]
MTRLKNDVCEIEIVLDDADPSDAAFQGRYDLILNPEDWRKDFSKAYFIRIVLADREYSVALIGDYNCRDTACAVLEEERLTVLQGWTIMQFDVLTASVIRSVTVDTRAPNFEIYKVKTGYLIYGETEITMLNSKLEKLWSFSGNDIFVSASDKPSFDLRADRICLYDFNGKHYELDFQGREIRPQTPLNRRSPADGE